MRKISTYFSLLLLSSVLCTPALVVAEGISSIGEETISKEEASQSSSEVVTTESTNESQASTSLSTVGQVVCSTEVSESTSDTTFESIENEQSSSTVNRQSIEPRAPSQKDDWNHDLNARGVQVITNIHITDMTDTPFSESNTPMYNDNIKIHFDWSLLDTEEIREGDVYTYQLPNYFAVHNQVEGTLARAGGEPIGTFSLNEEGELKIVFNSLAENLSNRCGVIDLVTELNVEKTAEEVEIATGIYDENNQEITLEFPVYEVDIDKKGSVNSNGVVSWEVIFNKDSRELKNVVVTDNMPQGLAYSVSEGYIYYDETDEWVKTEGLFTYNASTKEFVFNRVVTKPVKIVIKSTVNDVTIKTFKNTAVITGDNFAEQSAEANCYL